MMRPTPIMTAQPFAKLPEHLRHKGMPSDWAKMTRPGHAMHSFLEGAFFDSHGDLWLNDVPYGRVFRVAPQGAWHLEHQIDGAPHAMRIASDGRHIAVDYHHGLIELTGTGQFSVVSAGLKDHPFLGLSDMAYAPDGALWFTDSGRSSLSDPTGRLYVMMPDGQLRLVLENIPYSNGICLSPNGEWIYVAATRANQVWRLSARLPDTGYPMVGTFLQLSGGLGPDGLACNRDGWIAIAQAQAGRAYVFDALGDPIAEVRLPEGLWTTSVTFHPDNSKHLFIVDAQHGAIFQCDLTDI